MSEEPHNPFAQPGAESAPVRDTSRRTALIGAMLVLGLDQLARQVARNAMTSVLIGDAIVENARTFYSIAGAIGAFGPLAGGLLAMFLGARRTMIVAAIFAGLAHAGMAIEPSVEVAYVGALGRGMMWTPLAVLVGRRVIDAPELRDAWFTSTVAVVSAAGFLAGLAYYARSFLPISVVFAAAAALSLAVIPIVVAMLEDAPPAIAAPATSSRWSVAPLIAAAVVYMFANTMGGEMMLLQRDIQDVYMGVARGGISLLCAIGLAVIYLARNSPVRADDTRKKIALGGSCYALSTALIAADLVNAHAAVTSYAAVILQSAGYLLVWPVATGVAAARPSTRDAYLWVVLFSVPIALATVIVPPLFSWLGAPVVWVTAASSAALAIYLFTSRTDSETRSS